MSSRSLIELNHDYSYRMEEPGFLEALQRYLRSADQRNAEGLERYGVRVFGMRHHSDAFNITWGAHKASELKT